MKQIFTASSRIEAELISGKLKDCGFETFVQHDDQGGARPSLNFTQGIKIFVADEDFEAASEILKT